MILEEPTESKAISQSGPVSPNDGTFQSDPLVPENGQAAPLDLSRCPLI